MSGPYGPPQPGTPQGPPAGPPQGYQGGPGQGYPSGPPQGYNAPAAPSWFSTLGLEKILALAVAALGVLILFMGLLDISSATSVKTSFVTGAGWAVALYLGAGLLALGAVLPKAGSVTFAVAVISFSTTIALLFVLFGVSGAGAGFILVLILGFLQTVAAIFGYLKTAGIIKLAPKPPAYQQYGPGYPGGGYGGPPPGYGQAPPPQQAPQQQGPPPGYGQPGQGYPQQ